ncbi:hypothetical protein HYQ44_003209 [Verticillium longisporum]|nr:hypothetical protein HYQ44_003209 [Verticillium longisporum]
MVAARLCLNTNDERAEGISPDVVRLANPCSDASRSIDRSPIWSPLLSLPTVCPLLHSCSRRRTQAIYAFCPPTDPLYLILIKRGPSRTPARDRLTVVASHTTSTLPLLK